MNVLSVIIGALVSIAIVILVEGLRRPKLTIEIEDPPLDRTYDRVGATRWLRVLVRNEPLPAWARWMVRESATHCRGRLRFAYADNRRDVFGNEMGRTVV